MRAITGALLSSKPCSLAKAARILSLFADSAASHLPSSDVATYLRTATDATNDHHLFRRELQRYQKQRGDIDGTYEAEEIQGNKSHKKHRKHQRARDQDGERNAGEEENNVTVLAVAHGGSQGTAGEKKSKKKGAKEDHEPRDANQDEGEDTAALHRGLHSPVSEKTKKKKKDKHGKEEDKAGKALHGGLQAFLPEEEIDDEKKGNNNKKKKHLKQEKEARSAKEVEENNVHDGAAEQGIAAEEKKRKKMKHAAEDEEEKEKNVTDGDLGSDKKRKKKRGRGDDNDNDKELVEHTRKKQRKQSGN